MMWGTGEGWGWWMLFGWVWMVAFWGLVIWGIVTLVNRTGDGGGSSDERAPSALEILERRYARGEIGHDEFEEMRQRLTGRGAA